MSHLGEQVSALVDGELSGADLDRANAHIAGCERCRAEAAGLRELKRQLRALAADRSDDALTMRLLAMPGPRGQAVPRARPLPRPQHPPRLRRLRRRRYLVWSAVSVVFVGGIGTAAFTVGGGAGNMGPKVVPQVEVFNEEHAVNSGDVPFPDPTKTLMKTSAAVPVP